MKSRIRVLIAVLLALLLTAGTLAGCGRQSGEKGTLSENETSADLQGSQKEPVKDTDKPAADNSSGTDNPAAGEVSDDTGASADSGAQTDSGAKTESGTSAEAGKSEDTESSFKIPEISIGKKDLPQNSALAFVSKMKIGWNLGNTFDAYDCSWLSDELDYESAWCGVKTRDMVMKLVKSAGFNTVRIPVSWHNHVSGDDFQISEAWLSRVQEVVDYAIANDLYVILNIHHDMGEKYIYPTSQYLDQSTRYITSIWSQLAERFADYDERLIFESMNEPRMVGHKYEWWIEPNDKDCKDAINCINMLNQTFVDTVRSSGGNNANRYLMVPGYAASYAGALNQDFKLPADTVADKLIVSVHAYTPYNFALEAGGVNTFDINRKSSTQEIDYFMDQLYGKFVSSGTPVVIGEFGARNKKNNLQDRVNYSAYYVAAARARGMTCLVWDNHSFTGDGELFGLLDRRYYRWRYPEIIDAMMKYAE